VTTCRTAFAQHLGMARQDPAWGAGTLGARRRKAASACAWCRRPIAVRSRGPIPKWCSVGCRRTAWAQAQAAGSGRTAVTVVERIVRAPAEPVPKPSSPRRGDWMRLLQELTRQLDTGLLYDRDLYGVAGAVDEVVAAIQRRARFRRP
jgi:hypothetical protein